MENTHNFFMPRINLAGVGAIKDLGPELLEWKMKRALIVTDRNMVNLGYVERVQTILKSLFITSQVFEVVHPEPTMEMVQEGLEKFTKGLNVLKKFYSIVISIGGGSNHDCAKCIAALTTNGGSIAAYEGYNKITKPAVPIICINTTSGSGSEFTMSAVIEDTPRKVKMVIISPELMPLISVNDPLFMSTMPKQITASCGIDVITHAIETFLSIEASPITDGLSLKTIRLVCEYLPRVVDNGFDMEAREQMMYASMMGGITICNAGVGYAHSLAHVLGGYYHQIHGDYAAILMPHVLNYDATSVSADRMLDIADAMGIKASNKTQATDKIMKALQKMNTDLGIPQGLKEVGLNPDDIEQIAINALDDITAFVNPRKGTVEELVNILKAAM